MNSNAFLNTRTRTCFSVFFAILMRDLTFYARRKGEWFFPFLFCIMICSLFSMVFPYGPERLGEIAPSILWVSIILSSIFSLENIFLSDFKDGSLEQFLISPHPLTVLVLGKVLAHWLAMGLPFILIAPLLAIPLQLPMSGVLGLILSLVLGLPILSLLAPIAVALTLGLHKGGLFLTILVLPLMMPVLILGSSLVYAASLGLPFTGQIALLLAIGIFSLCLAPMTIAAALKIGVIQ